MNVWAEIALKIGEKMITHQLKQNIWNNPNTTRQQKQHASKLIDGASMAKDVYDIVRIVNATERKSTSDK